MSIWLKGLTAALATAMAAATLPSAVVAAADVQTPRFIDETASSGLRHVYQYQPTPEVPDGGFEFVVGGGMSVLDCDDDGRPDLYFAGGSGPASLYRNESEPGGPLQFRRLAGDETDLAQVSGAYPIDVDSDGRADLIVLRRGENVLLRGLGDCRFERANETMGLDPATTGPRPSVPPGTTAPRYRRSPSATTRRWTESGRSPRAARTTGSSDLIPDATTYGPALTLSPGWCALSMLFSDWDRSGRRDLRISNDREFYVQDGQEQLWRMGDGEQPTLYSEEDGWQRVNIWGMGIASQDLRRRRLPGDLSHQHVRQPPRDPGRWSGATQLREHRQGTRRGFGPPGRRR